VSAPSPLASRAVSSRRSALWAPDRRATTVGLLLLITLIAFEAMSIGTALPTIVAELQGQRLYSWPFTAFLAASVIGTVLSGQVIDRSGPRLALLGGPALFGLGLVVAGLAPTMELLLAGRVLQGLGAGTQTVAIYVLIALVYPERDRPAAFGALAAAWVLPAVIGPTVAGLLTDYASWRWVFLGLAPLVLLGMGLLVPLVRRLPARHSQEIPAGDRHEDDDAAKRPGVLPAAVAAAVGLSALAWAAQHPSAAAVVMALGGLALLAPALRRILPAGTLVARRGLPAVVLSRGVMTGAFFAVEAYLPLTLTAVHGTSPAMAGLPLTVGALGWSAMAAWQGRRPRYPRDRLLRNGFLVLAIGLAGSTVAAFTVLPFWAVLPFWTLAGAGMGFAMPSVSVKLLELSPPAERGFNSAALQIWDMLLSAATIGFGGALLVTIASASAPTPAVVILNVLMSGLALAGALLAKRVGHS
jgi:MFS family permease